MPQRDPAIVEAVLIVERMPFPIKAIQVDGGSEFQGEFEEACRQRASICSCCRRIRRS